MLQVQAQSVAIAYLEEVMLRSGACTLGSALNSCPNRQGFSTVCDYHGLTCSGDIGVPGAGTALEQLANYQVEVAVSPQMLSGVAMYRIDVSVQDPLGQPTQLSAYRRR
jgi:hypothetical protein